MCVSPEEMTTSRIRELIAGLKELIVSYQGTSLENYYKGELKNYELLLTERSDGTLPAEPDAGNGVTHRNQFNQDGGDAGVYNAGVATTREAIAA